jgi:hypothetical protein
MAGLSRLAGGTPFLTTQMNAVELPGGGRPTHTIQMNAVEFPGAALSPQARVRF